MRFAIVAGGTGGHIYPGIAIADEIARRFPAAEIIFIGSEEGMEKKLIPKSGYRLVFINSRPLIRKLSLRSATAPFTYIIGLFQSLRLLKKFGPQAVISTGGYASLPVVLAARLLRLPLYIHEQNILPGITNRLCFRLAKKIFLSFPGSLSYAGGIVTGNPVRQEILSAERSLARKRLGLEADDFAVLVLGGSQGARKINQAVVAALPLLQNQPYKIMHVVGSRDFDLIKPENDYSFYKRFEYLYNIADMIAAADIAVSRAGATAIAEYLAKGIPMILIPFPFSAENHQELNAAAIKAGGAAIVLHDADLSPENLLSALHNCRLNLKEMIKTCLKLARPRAAEEIVNAIL